MVPRSWFMDYLKAIYIYSHNKSIQAKNLPRSEKSDYYLLLNSITVKKHAILYSITTKLTSIIKLFTENYIIVRLKSLHSFSISKISFELLFFRLTRLLTTLNLYKRYSLFKSYSANSSRMWDDSRLSATYDESELKILCIYNCWVSRAYSYTTI